MQIKFQIFIILTICFTGFQNALAQQCDGNRNGFTFYNQDDVDNFASSHPSCDLIDGNLVIGPEVVNIDGLHSIIGIGGALIIEDNPIIESLSGLDNLESIGGILIKNCGALTNMMGLSNLIKIEGNLFIQDCAFLSDLAGLNNLDSIKGSLMLWDNELLHSLNGLTSVDYYGSHISLINCGKIGDLQGLLGLIRVRGDFTITSNPELDSLKGLKSLERIDGNFVIRGNPDLNILGRVEADIQYGPYQLEQIDGDLIIEDNDVLLNLSGLNGLQRILQDFMIEDNQVLTNLSHLIGLLEVAGGIYIRKNTDLINLSGFDQLKDLGSIRIYDNPSLTSLYGLHNLKTINGDFGLAGNISMEVISGGEIETGTGSYRLLDLQDIDGNLFISGSNAFSMLGFYNLESIGGDLIISRNDFLRGVWDFANLKYINGTLSFSYNLELLDIRFSNLKYVGGLSFDNNRSLDGVGGLFNLEEIGNDGLLIEEDNELFKSLQGLEKVRYIAGDLKLYDSDLRDFSGIYPDGGLSNLDSIGGSLWLELNRPLFSFNGLNNLKSIGKDLIIQNSFSLVSIFGLSKLKRIDGRIDISQNQYLTSLVGLDSIDSESIQDLSLSSNFELSGCEVLSICNYLFNNRSADIAGNAMNCSSIQEVQEACNALTVGVEELGLLSNITLAPNPLSDFISIRSEVYHQFEFQIYNILGRKIKSGIISSNDRTDISQLIPGTYMIRLDLKEEYTHLKFVKI